MNNLARDVRVALRMLLRRPGFTASAVFCLALGIGSATALFTLVDAIFLNMVPVHEPERLIEIYGSDENTSSTTGIHFLPTSVPNYREIAAQAKAVSPMAAFSWMQVSMAGGGEPERIFAQIVTPNYFEVLGVNAALGRTIAEADDRSPVLVLSHVLWRDRFGGDPKVIGRTVLLNTHRFTIIGVMPEGFRGTNNVTQPRLWVPFGIHPLLYPHSKYVEERKWRLISIIGRLAPSATVAQARTELETIAARLEQAYPNENKDRGVKVVPLTEAMVSPNHKEEWYHAGLLPLAIVALILVIACISVSCLLLARATSRNEEMAIRVSLGASRSRVARQLLTESVLLAFIGGIFGILLALWSKGVLVHLLPEFVDRQTLDVDLSFGVLAFALCLSLLTAMLFGLAPALQASKPQFGQILKTQGAARAQVSARHLLIVAQIALSTVSLVGAGLFIRSLRNAHDVDLGFDGKNLLTLTFDLADQGYDEERARQFRERLLDQVRAVPRVKAVTLSETTPLAPVSSGVIRRVAVEGRPVDPSGGMMIRINGIAPDFLQVLGTPMVRGRAFTTADRKDSPRVAIINEYMAKTLWPGEDAVGRRFVFMGEPDAIEVVGIARDNMFDEADSPPQPHIYLPLEQRAGLGWTLSVRAAESVEAVVGPVRERIRALDPNLPVLNPGSIEYLVADSLWARRLAAWLLGLFGVISLMITGIGLYGVVAYSVSQRNREIGIRMSLGARRQEVLWMIVRQSLTIATVGVALGLAGSVVGIRLVRSMLFGVEPWDASVLLTVAMILLLVVAVAALVPARKASRIDPVKVLRVG